MTRRLRLAAKHARLGLLRDRFPPCCVARFVADTLRQGRASSGHRGSTWPDRDGKQWVPCGLLHQARQEPLWPPFPRPGDPIRAARLADLMGELDGP